MKKILVPFDFSHHAESALQFAIEFNQVYQANITLLHVIEYPLGTTFNVTGEIGQIDDSDKIFTLEFIRRTKKKMDALINSEKYSGFGLKPHIMVGNPYRGIYDMMNDESPDLIIMGTKGATGLKEMFIGSNAEKVVRNAKCPVITIHHGQKFKNINNIVFASDLNPSNPALDVFKSFQKIFNARLHLVWVFTPDAMTTKELADEKLKLIAQQHQLENVQTYVLRGYHTEESLLRFTREHRFDMIALATHSRKGLNHLFFGSIAEGLVNHSQVPVWTMSLKHKSFDDIKH